MTFIFYFTDLTGGNKYKQEITADDFRTARSIFFEMHHAPHKIDAVWNETTGEKMA